MKPMPRIFIALCWVMAVLFSLSVGLQVNDPDPLRWMAVYGAAAIAAALLPARKRFAILAVVVGLVAAAWGASLYKDVKDVLELSDLWLKMSEKGGAVEVGREAGGLLVVAVGLLLGSAFRVTRS